MKPLSAETRAMFDDLRAAERVSPSQVDQAWRRFTARQARGRRVVLGLWLGAGLAAVAAAVVLVPSLRVRLGQASDVGGSNEAIMQREMEALHEAEVAGTQRSASSSSAASAGATEASPAPAVAAPMGASRARSAATPSRSSEARPMRSTPTEATAASEATESSASAPSLAAELALLDDAEAALRRGDHDGAARLLRDHHERFPAGALAEERRLLDARLSTARSSR